MDLIERRIIENWLREHTRVKSTIDKHARMSKCVTMEGLVVESGLSEPEIERHRMVFELHGYLIAPIERTYCSINALKSVYKKLSS